MASTPGYTDADMDPAFRRRRLRAVKRSIDSIPSARIPELEHFVATLRPTPLSLEIEEGSQPAWLEPFRELARGWSLPAMNELDKLDDRDLARMRLLSWLMRQEPEDKSRDWGAFDSLVSAEVSRRGRTIADLDEVWFRQVAESLFDIWQETISATGKPAD